MLNVWLPAGAVTVTVQAVPAAVVVQPGEPAERFSVASGVVAPASDTVIEAVLGETYFGARELEEVLVDTDGHDERQRAAAGAARAARRLDRSRSRTGAGAGGADAAAAPAAASPQHQCQGSAEESAPGRCTRKMAITPSLELGITFGPSGRPPVSAGSMLPRAGLGFQRWETQPHNDERALQMAQYQAEEGQGRRSARRRSSPSSRKRLFWRRRTASLIPRPTIG